MNEKLTAEEIHKLAVAPLPKFNIISLKTHSGRTIIMRSYGYDGLFNMSLQVEGYSFDRNNK